jgi:hypothetical protein
MPRTQIVPQADAAIGRLHAWWKGDPLPTFSLLQGLSLAPTDDGRLICALAAMTPAEFQARANQGHQPWLARIDREPVGWGWSASSSLSIGELGIACRLPAGNRYLWDFVTVAPWRGRGIYPRLLQAIVSSDPGGERFWVGHDLPNVASARGITKAGFQEVGVVCRLSSGAFELVPCGSAHRAEAASVLFGIPIADRLAAHTLEWSGGFRQRWI